MIMLIPWLLRNDYKLSFKILSAPFTLLRYTGNNYKVVTVIMLRSPFTHACMHACTRTHACPHTNIHRGGERVTLLFTAHSCLQGMSKNPQTHTKHNDDGWKSTHSSGYLHLLCAPMEDFFQREEEITLDGWILLLGTTAMETTKSHAQVTVHSVVKLWKRQIEESHCQGSWPQELPVLDICPPSLPYLETQSFLCAI